VIIGKSFKSLLLLALCLGVVILMGIVSLEQETAYAQHPTLSIPTVTGTPAGPIASVYQNLVQIPVRSGPGQNYPEVGLLTAGQKVPAVGSSPGGDWVKIVYPGVPGGTAWVFGNLVSVSGPLPAVSPPPTPTPRVTPTLDPTLAAQAFVENIQPTRLPTFTSAPPLVLPTFEASEPGFMTQRNIPMGFVVVGLAVVGLFGIFLSLLRGR
jgi:hypothetical protein